MKTLPICIDLDGTLIRNDITMCAMKKYASESILHVFCMIFWLFRGIAYFKYKLASKQQLDHKCLHYNQPFLNFLMQKKSEGYKLYLATACNKAYAKIVSDELNIFDDVFASDHMINLRAKAKAKALVKKFGKHGFAYAGNSLDDIYVWDKSAECILVAPNQAVLKRMKYKSYTLFN